MNVLINPISMIQEGYTPPPLGLLHIAAMDPNTIVIDHARNHASDITTILKQHNPKIVGVPVYTLGRKTSIEILRIAKSLGAITVAGGAHTSLMADQMAREYPFIDHLVVGDGELAWKAITSGTDLSGDHARIIDMRVEDLSTLPCPAWHLINIKHYQAWGEGVHRGYDLTKEPRCPIVFGRGCKGSCAFCSTWMINGKYRHYNLDYMDCLLKALWAKGVRHLGWQDDCLTADMDATRELCGILSHYNFASFGTTRVDCLDDSLADELANSGFYELSFGIESGSPEILKAMGKRTDLSIGLAARAACRAAGIKFTALMIDNYPGESGGTRLETQRYLRLLNPDKVCSLGQTLVLPGTRIYEQYKAAGKINDDYWLSDAPAYTA
jgi:anaerobic magnesium-protoporphyrin IX monomethyl ester cyclase